MCTEQEETTHANHILSQSPWRRWRRQRSEDIADKYPQSELYNKPVEVIPHVFSAIGATAPPTYENAATTTT